MARKKSEKKKLTYYQRWMRQHPRVTFYLTKDEHELIKRQALLKNMTVKEYVLSLIKGESESYKMGHEEGYKKGYDEGYKKGKEEGYYKGYEEGKEIGREEGYEKGHKDGYKKGYEEGYKEGKEKGYKKGYEEGYKKGYEDCQKEEARKREERRLLTQDGIFSIVRLE